MVSRFIMSAVCILALTAFKANAAVVYSYTGNNFINAISPYTTDMNITLQFTTAVPLSATGGMTDVTSEVLSYTMFDGRKTLTEVDAESSFFLNIDAMTGLPIEWSISASNAIGKSVGDIVNRMIMFFGVNGSQDFAEEGVCGDETCTGWDDIIFAEVFNPQGASGSWSVVPIPAAVWLFGSGLIGLIGIARRKKS